MATWATVLAEIRAEVEEASAGVWTDAQILSHANYGLRDFARKTRVNTDEQELATVANQRSYDLPDNTTEVAAIRYTDDALAWADYGETFTLTATGVPTHYSVYNDQIHLYPMPTLVATFTVLRSYEPATMTATADMPFSSKYDDAIKYYVKSRLYEQAENLEMAMHFDALYQREVDETDFERIRAYTANVSLSPANAW